MLCVIQNLWLVSFADQNHFLTKEYNFKVQPLDAGIIQNFKVKYQNRLVKYVLARIQEGASATQIVKRVDGLWLFDSYKKRGKT